MGNFVQICGILYGQFYKNNILKDSPSTCFPRLIWKMSLFLFLSGNLAEILPETCEDIKLKTNKKSDSGLLPR